MSSPYAHDCQLATFILEVEQDCFSRCLLPSYYVKTQQQCQLKNLVFVTGIIMKDNNTMLKFLMIVLSNGIT